MKTFVLFRPERLKRVGTLLSAEGIDAELVLGPDPAPSAGRLSPQEVSCYEGHRAMLRKAEGEMSLVLEDDFAPVSGWRDLLATIISEADRPWDIINLGRYLTIGGVPLWPGVEDSYAFTTHAYLLSPGARVLRTLPDPLDTPIDWEFLRCKALGLLNVYTANPRLFRQDRAGCPGLIHQDTEPPELWPPERPMPWMT